jgi:hypothetical protein
MYPMRRPVLPVSGERSDHVFIPVALIRQIEEYLGDRPASDTRASDLHERIVKRMMAEGLL